MSNGWQISIKTGLAVGVFASVVLTATLIHVPWSWTARGNVGALTERLNAEIIRGLGDKVSALLDGAVSTERAIAANITAGVVDLGDHAKRAAFFLSFLRGQLTLSSIEFIWPDDRAFATRRMDDRSFDLDQTTPLPAGGTRHWIDHYELDAKGDPAPAGASETASAEMPTTQYWYRLAEAEPSWSNIYPMAGTGELGVTAAGTVMGPAGMVGVLAVSLALERISGFLQGVEVSPHGTVFLTNIYGELVATRDAPAAAGAGGPSGLTRIGKLDQAQAPLVQLAVKALAAHRIPLREIKAPRQVSFYNEPDGETYFVTLAPLAEMGLIVALVVPESDILGEIARNTRFLSYALAGFLVATVVMVMVLAHFGLAVPLVRVTGTARQLGAFDFDAIRPTPSRLTEIRALSHTISQMGASLSSFSKYVPTEVVRQLFAQGMEARLGGEQRELSILFMDLANFTRISEALGEALIPFLAIYLSEMSATLRAGEATIDKYIGDAIMAFWGAPIPAVNHAMLACRAALACQRRLAELRDLRAESELPELRARIGINSGRVLVGNVGSSDRLNYTAIGDPVNVASRLESLNKHYGTEILIGEDCHDRVRDAVVVRRLDRVAVYGKTHGTTIYELVDLSETATAVTRAWIDRFEQGRIALAACDWAGAETCFTEVIAARGGADRPSSMMIERIHRWRNEPPARGWDGVIMLGEK